MDAFPDWNKDTISSSVSIGTHSLFLRAAGPARPPKTPAIIIVPGIGDSSGTWRSVTRHVSNFARIYAYDRTGLGKSDIPANYSSESKRYVSIAEELKQLLNVAEIRPPYILVMHSVGGIPGREFLDMYPEDVAGMVFLDTVTEENYKTRPKELPRIMREMNYGLDMSFLWTERKPVMTDNELGEALALEGYAGDHRSEAFRTRNETCAFHEAMNLIPSSHHLAAKGQFETTLMGDKPVSVVKGDAPGEWRRRFEIAVAAGRGTEEERRLISEYLAIADSTQLWLQFRQVRLSRNSRLVEARDSWHDIHWYQPDHVAREARWCLEEFEKLSNSGIVTN